MTPFVYWFCLLASCSDVDKTCPCFTPWACLFCTLQLFYADMLARLLPPHCLSQQSCASPIQVSLQWLVQFDLPCCVLKKHWFHFSLEFQQWHVISATTAMWISEFLIFGMFGFCFNDVHSSCHGLHKSLYNLNHLNTCICGKDKNWN